LATAADWVTWILLLYLQSTLVKNCRVSHQQSKEKAAKIKARTDIFLVVC